MQSNFYVGLSAQMAIEKRLQTVANNVANMNTTGFRADGVSFETILSNTGDVVKTDNPLDVAVQGDGWFGIKTPSGVAYTHDGRLKMSETGEVQTLNGDQVLDAGGSSLILDPDAGPPVISADGMMTQNGHQVGAIGLFNIQPDAKLTHVGTSAVTTDKPAVPVLDFTNTGVAQGFTENSNVNPTLELSKLISIQHALDGITQMNQTADSSLQDAIKTLGSAA